MRKQLLSAVLFGMSTFAMCAATWAQGAGGAATQPKYAAGANAARYGVAVVDVSYLFKNYPAFKGAMESLQAEMKQADEALTAKRDAILKREQLRDEGPKPGTVEFKQLDEQIAREKADFQIQTGTLRRDIAEKESKIYFQTYTAVNQAISAFARSNNIGLVLRFIGDEIDPTQPNDIKRAVTQPIVFQNNIDITPFILDILNPANQSRVSQPQTARQPTGRPR